MVQGGDPNSKDSDPTNDGQGPPQTIAADSGRAGCWATGTTTGPWPLPARPIS
ncbi:MAG: hypothetical protein WKG07_24710 [Hymenobacter sp.]